MDFRETLERLDVFGDPEDDLDLDLGVDTDLVGERVSLTLFSLS